MKVLFMKIIVKILFIFLLFSISFFSIFLISYNQEHTQTHIEPFGLSFGMKDVEYVKSKQIVTEYENSYYLKSPIISPSVYQELDAKGYCRTTFDDALIKPTSIYYLKETLIPLKLPEPLSDKIIYRVKVHPIIGIYSISALINPKMPQNFLLQSWVSWSLYVNDVVKSETLEILNQKYSNLHYYLKSIIFRSQKEFESVRTDGRGRKIHITLNHELSKENEGGTSISYVWQFMGLYDNELDDNLKKLKKCDEELQLIYQFQEKQKKLEDENIKETEIEKEKERKTSVQNSL